ncbi:hypothetical protein GCM10027289_21760 [Tsukamurella serpentis]
MIAGALAAACGVTGIDSSRAGSSLTFDPLPSSAPSGASAAPGPGGYPGALPSGQTAASPAPPAPATMTVLVPPPNAPAAPPADAARVPVAPAAPPTGPGNASGSGDSGNSATGNTASGNTPGGNTAGSGNGAQPAPGGDAGRPAAPSSGRQAPAQPKPALLPDGSVDCARSKCVALTFSGGPGPVTRQFLQALDSYGGKGTFFVTGAQVSLNPDIMTAIAGTGNEVANGTWTQPDMTTLSDAEGSSQLQQTNDAIRSSVGITPTLFRPMGGHTNAAVVDAGKRLGLTQVLWDLDSRDYNYQADPDGLTKVLMQVKPGQIVMLHDTFVASAQALERTMAALTEQGYAFVTVSQLLRTRAG